MVLLLWNTMIIKLETNISHNFQSRVKKLTTAITQEGKECSIYNYIQYNLAIWKSCYNVSNTHLYSHVQKYPLLILTVFSFSRLEEFFFGSPLPVSRQPLGQTNPESSYDRTKKKELSLTPFSPFTRLNSKSYLRGHRAPSLDPTDVGSHMYRLPSSERISIV